MKRTTTLMMAPVIVGVAIAISVLSSFGHEGFGFWQWCLGVFAALLIVLVIGALLNFAIFAPVYWLLGRLHSKRRRTDTSPEQKT